MNLSLSDNLQRVIDERRLQYPSIILLEANLPGIFKSPPQSMSLLRTFQKRLQDLGYQELSMVPGLNTILWFSSHESGPVTKQRMIALEEEPIGRLIDLDVYDQTQRAPYSRQILRRCYLCHQSALVCRKQRNHSISDLRAYFFQQVETYFFERLQSATRKVLTQELHLEPKFGLVSPSSKGSHADMDVQLFERSIDVLQEQLPKFFLLGMKHLPNEEGFLEARKLGLEIERLMFEATSYVNTHAGIVFHFSLYFLALGTHMSQPLDQEGSFQAWLTKWCTPFQVEQAHLERHKETSIARFGARYEAISGYPTIQPYITKTVQTKLEQLHLLVDLIIHSADSTTLKRAKNLETYEAIIEKFKQLDLHDERSVNQLHQECIQNNWTFGGAADLFSLVLLHQFIHNEIYPL